jgi:hypothetical protein
MFAALLLPYASQARPRNIKRNSIAMQKTDANAMLQAQFQYAENVLSISYQFNNYCNSDIFLFNKMYDDVDDEGRYKVNENLCNIEASNGQLIISKKVPTLPESLLVESLNLPCVTLVAPGTSFRETVVQDLPLQLWSPYESVGAPISLALPTFFQIGYFVATTTSKPLARTVSTTAGKALRFVAVTPGSQILLTTGPFQPVSTLPP